MTPSLAKRSVRAAKSGAGLFCLGVVLLLQTLASVPVLHEWVHHDARDASHECAVTLFLNGQVHCSSTDIVVVKHLAVPVFHEPARRVDFVSTDVRLLPSRGPPACLFVSFPVRKDSLTPGRRNIVLLPAVPGAEWKKINLFRVDENFSL